MCFIPYKCPTSKNNVYHHKKSNSSCTFSFRRHLYPEWLGWILWILDHFHVFATMHNVLMLDSLGFTLQFYAHTKQLGTTCLRPAVITYMGCLSLYWTLIGLCVSDVAMLSVWQVAFSILIETHEWTNSFHWHCTIIMALLPAAPASIMVRIVCQMNIFTLQKFYYFGVRVPRVLSRSSWKGKVVVFLYRCFLWWCCSPFCTSASVSLPSRSIPL